MALDSRRLSDWEKEERACRSQCTSAYELPQPSTSCIGRRPLIMRLEADASENGISVVKSKRDELALNCGRVDVHRD